MKYNFDFLNIFTNEDIEINLDEPMNKHTSFKIGGKADVYCEVKTKKALAQLICLCKKNEIPYFIIGKGSNLLISDNGIRGIVIRLGGEFSEMSLTEDGLIRCGSGAALASVCSYALKNSLSGLEFAWGIPGTVGGAAYMNAGAYGGEMKDIVEAVSYIDENGIIKSFKRDELNFSYRRSVFTDKEYIVTDVLFKLENKPQNEIREKMDELMGKRKSKQPLEYPSAGSTFKRPEGYFAAALIEECGLKGASVGGAEVSEKHSGFIINKNNATCEDVKNLIAYVKKEVYKQKGVELHCEVKFIGT